MTDLRTHLERAATGAPPALPHADLWARGRRLHRRRQVGTLVVAAVAAVIVVVLAGLAIAPLRTDRGPVAPAHGTPHLFDHLYEPSPWLPGTRQKGPLGVAIAVFPAERKSFFHDRYDRIVGVSAQTGEYRFLDLPGFMGSDRGDDEVALSPDGTHLAYWTSSPGTYDGDTGVAIYDLRTGRTERAAYPTRYGIEGYALVWSTDEQLLLEFGDVVGPTNLGASGPGTTYLWRLGATRPRALPSGPDVNGGVVDGRQANGRGLVMLPSGDSDYQLRPLYVGKRLRSTTVRISLPIYGYPSPNRTGTQVAGLWAGPHPEKESSTPTGVVVGSVSSSGVNRFRLLPSFRGAIRMVGWRDGAHVLVQELAHPDAGSGYYLTSVDVDTGAAHRLSRLHDWGDGVQFAGDLLGAPVVPGHRPESPHDPRVLAGLAGAAAVVGVLAIVVWRRRVRT